MNQFLKTIFIVVGLVLLGYLIWEIRVVFVYFFIAVAITFVGRPMIRWLMRLHIGNFRVPSWLAAIVTLTSFIALIGALVSLFFPIVAEEALILTGLDLTEISYELERRLHDIDTYLAQIGVEQNTQEYLQGQLESNFNMSTVNMVFGGVMSSLGDLIIAVFSILFITFFLMKDGYIINSIVESITPDKYLERIKSVITDTKNLLTRYFLGVFIQVTLITTLVTIGLKIVGVDNALLIGLIAGVVNVIPYLGPLIGGAIGILLSISPVLDQDVSTVIYPIFWKVLLVFSIVQMLDNFIFQPFIFSTSVRAHPLEIFLVIMISGSLAGIIGMVLAVPVYTLLRILGREFFEGYKIVRGLTKDLD